MGISLEKPDVYFYQRQRSFSKREVDFGSRLLIEAFREPDAEGDFLDVGCGYGPIGLSLAADFEDRMVHMIDVNERACRTFEGKRVK